MKLTSIVATLIAAATAVSAAPYTKPQPKLPQVVTNCVKPNTIAITFDDGPYNYTLSILSQLKAANVKATWFMNGHAYSCIYNSTWSSNAYAVYKAGHQVASHTWSHPNLTTVDLPRLNYEVTKQEDALAKVVGVRPTFIRPPFGSYNETVLKVFAEHGYSHVVLWGVFGDNGADLATWKNNYDTVDTSKPLIALNHDPRQLTVTELVSTFFIFVCHFLISTSNVVMQQLPYILQWVKKHNFKMVTVGECLGVPKNKWYKWTGSPSKRDKTWTCANTPRRDPIPHGVGY
ncbi:Carbohydrate esterase 4 protein [Rhizophlyctis rosea]|uniref:Carbohydrate esterase 4 protein n=1 Tax=Rhizophlyctis rosea TaxID=64517 RepID=A0AAD5X7N0_9FUNG|nr:Carbohydrate esterase 4 protein [Rhizophlyctis rosea]